MRYSPTGRHLYAIGNDAHAARLQGVRVTRRLVSVLRHHRRHGRAGRVVFIGGGGRIGQAVGTGFELQVIAAVVIGGTSILGGRGTVFGTVLGALLVGTVSAAVTLLGWPSRAVTALFIGVFILVAVGVDLLRHSEGGSRCDHRHPDPATPRPRPGPGGRRPGPLVRSLLEAPGALLVVLLVSAGGLVLRPQRRRLPGRPLRPLLHGLGPRVDASPCHPRPGPAAGDRLRPGRHRPVRRGHGQPGRHGLRLRLRRVGLVLLCPPSRSPCGRGRARRRQRAAVAYLRVPGPDRHPGHLLRLQLPGPDQQRQRARSQPGPSRT